MATITIEGVQYTYDEAIVGSDKLTDILTGTDDNVRYFISGLNQGDFLTGAGNADTIVGGHGADTLVGRAGNDILVGDHVNAQGLIVGDASGEAVLEVISPPGLEANWKAWENYENRLKEFFGSIDLAASYKLNGVAMTGQQLSDAWILYNTQLTIEDVHVISGKKLENDNGNDTAIHDVSDNLDLWETLNGVGDQSESAAFLNFGTVEVVGSSAVTNIDKAVYSGQSNNYTVVVDPQFVTVQDNVGSDGLDKLFGIEQIEFADQTLAVSWFTKAASVPAAQFGVLTDMYIAYFDRAPDAVGLCYWASRLSEGMSLQQIAKSFFVQTETLAAYPASQTTAEFVTKVYDNVLGRDPDQPGLNYWVNSLQTGDVSKDEFMLAIIYGARAATGSPADVQYLANKNVVGKDYAVTEGLNNVAWAKAVMADVDGTAASVQAALQVIDGIAATAALPNSPELVVQLIGVAV